jgi:hypothetical protein
MAPVGILLDGAKFDVGKAALAKSFCSEAGFQFALEPFWEARKA